MAKTVEYEGYTIHSTPQYQTDSEQWQLRIFLSFKDHQGTRTREFSADVLYATEQEADIHGTTFGQRLIDGKVEGQSVMDMRTEDRRATPRLRVQFRTTFSTSSKLEETGNIIRICLQAEIASKSGHREAGMSLEIKIQDKKLERTIIIEAAGVQWVSGQIFGLAFFQIREDL